MKRIVTTLTLTALGVAVLALPALAQDRPPVAMADGAGRHVGGILRCLRGLDLTDTQKADIKAILDAAKPTIQADADAIHAARQKLDTDYQTGADKSVLGQDYIDLRTAVKKLQDDGTAVKNQVLGKLTPDQQTQAQACLSSHPGMGMMMRHFEQ